MQVWPSRTQIRCAAYLGLGRAIRSTADRPPQCTRDALTLEAVIRRRLDPRQSRLKSTRLTYSPVVHPLNPEEGHQEAHQAYAVGGR